MAKSVLIIDDSDTIREQIVRTIGEAALFDQIHQAGDGIEAFKILLATPIDLIICDLEMPRIDGIKLLGMIATRDELRDIPVIMLTGREDRDLKVRLLGQGASDYVTKPFDAGELVARVRVHLKIKSLQDELKRSNEMLTQLSNTDPLTGLHNRRYLMDMLEREITRTKRKGTHLSLIMLDIDHFKRVNDLYGHQSGDQVLVAVAKLAASDLRSYDVTARYGGEEFVIALPETSHADALMIAERVRQHIELCSFTGPISQLKVTVSMGVATYPTDAISTIDDLFRDADAALYRAKKAGRNRIVSMNRVQA
jgi:diguanylate cyclase (GGDEF)-like protein